MYIIIKYSDIFSFYILASSLFILLFFFYKILNTNINIPQYIIFLLFFLYVVVLFNFIFTNVFFFLYISYEFLFLLPICIILYLNKKNILFYKIKYFLKYTQSINMFIFIVFYIFYINDIIYFNNTKNFEYLSYYNKFLFLFCIFIPFSIKILIFPWYILVIKIFKDLNIFFFMFLFLFYAQIALYGFFKCYISLNCFFFTFFFLSIIFFGIIYTFKLILEESNVKILVILMTTHSMHIIFFF